MAQLSTCAALLMMTLSLTCVGAEGQQVHHTRRPSIHSFDALVFMAGLCVQVHLRRVQVSPPGNTSLSASEYEALLDLMGNENGTKLNSLYR